MALVLEGCTFKDGILQREKTPELAGVRSQRKKMLEGISTTFDKSSFFGSPNLYQAKSMESRF
jgi:hypothetical protein